MLPISSPQAALDTQALLASLRSFLFPAGGDAAHLVHAVRITESGQLRMSPTARWIPFTSELKIDSTRSSFLWEARLDPGKITSVTVIDAYDEGRGRLAVKLRGVLPVKKITGPDADKGELQRYLASVLLCPPMLSNHPSLECAAIAPRTLRISDRQDPTGATVELEISEQSCPLACRATRPRLVGKESVSTPWFATSWEFREINGMRIPHHLKAGWELPEGPFPYYQSQIVSFTMLRE